MGELKVGDRVFGEDGQPCYVVAKSPVWKDRPVYRVTTDDGDTIVADAAHEWRACLCRKRRTFRLYSTAALAGKRQKRAMVERQMPLQLPEAELPIDPYLLGVWLGDGSSHHATITQSIQDIGWMRAQFEAMGYETTDRSTPDTFGVLGLQVQLRELGVLENKHIPAAYLRASELQRLALLRGLIDTDGHVDRRGQIEFTSTDLGLALGVQELVHSLGTKCGIAYGRATLDGRDCGPKYRVTFYMADGARMPRKWARCRNAIVKPHRYVSAEECGTADTACIEVDSPSHMYLCGRSMLPTHNSEFWAKWFPAWFLGMYPDRRVILGSYNSDNASEWGQKVRDVLEEHGVEFFGVRVRPDKASKHNWGLESFRDGGWKATDGGMRTMGMDAGITGKPADLFLIDDPVKGAEDALSPAIRQRVWDVFASCVDSRIQPDGAICLTMTPWHPDDLGGRLLVREPGRWKVLRLPALAERTVDAEVRARRQGYDALIGAPDPMGRPPGRALWPERFDEAHYEHKRRLDPFWFDALYQCQPKPRDGGFFKAEWFAGRGQVYVPREATRVRAWDTASSYNKGDYTAGVLLAENNGLFYVEDVRRFRLGPDDRDRMIRETADADKRKHGHRVAVWIEQGFGGGGKTEAEALVKKLAGHAVRLQTNQTNKEARAQPFASQCQAGNVKYCWGDWNEAYLDELTGFPNGKHDDQVDATSLAFAKLALAPEPGGYDALDRGEFELLEAGGSYL